MWSRLPEGNAAQGWTEEEYRERFEKILQRLLGLCTPEIIEAMKKKPVQSALSGVWFFELEVEEVPMPEEVPEWAGLEGDMIEWDGWTVFLVRKIIAVIAQKSGEDAEELIEAAIKKAHLDVISAKMAAERVERDLHRMRRERLLPDEKTLEKVQRYEAHLSRLLYKTLHALEALQTRRTGGSAPLARLDVDGLAGS